MSASPLFLVVFFFTLSLSATVCDGYMRAMKGYAVSLDDVVALVPKTVEEAEGQKCLVIDFAEDILAHLRTIKPEDRTFDNTIRAFDRARYIVNSASLIMRFLGFSHPDEAIRGAAVRAKIFLDNYENNEIFSFSLWQAINEYLRFKSDDENLHDEESFFLAKIVDEFSSRHVSIEDPVDREEALSLERELVALNASYLSIISSDSCEILASENELLGLDKDVVASFAQREGRIVLKNDAFTSDVIMKHCESASLRRRYHEMLLHKSCADNFNLFDKVVQKRRELARRLGEKSWAHLSLRGQMAATPKNVRSFLAGVRERALGCVEKDIALMTKELPSGVFLCDGKIHPADYLYILERYRKKNSLENGLMVSEYFPYEQTIDRVLDWFGSLFGLSFSRDFHPDLYDENVSLLTVKGRGEVIGYIILDLFDRPHKLNNDCVHWCGSRLSLDGSDGVAIATLQTNFLPPSDGKTTLLSPTSVQKFAHELGHALHHILSEVTLPSLTGDCAPFDFVEVPSMLFENWFKRKEVLVSLSGHYKTGEKLSKEDVLLLEQSSQFGQFENILRLAYLSDFFLSAYGDESSESSLALFSKIKSLYVPFLEPTTYDRSYIKLTHNVRYDARIYCYLWSRFVADDCLGRIEELGGHSPVVGQKLLRDVFSKGISADPNEMIRDFLGRDFNQELFWRHKGIA